MRFSGKHAVVTGGASGIGRATALRLADEGATVWMGDIDEAGGQAVADASDGRIRFRRCDVMQPADIEALIAAPDAEGGIDLLFNNAGAGGAPAPIDEIDAEGWDRTQALLLRSVALGTRYAAPRMAARGGGAIVNTASIAGLQAGAGPIAYSVAKAAVIHLTKVSAAQLAKHNVRVNAVCPGFIVTNIFTASLAPDDEQRAIRQHALATAAPKAQPVRRAGETDDVARLVAFLLSDDAGFITGTHVVVDGGVTVGPRHAWDVESPSLLSAIAAAQKEPVTAE